VTTARLFRDGRPYGAVMPGEFPHVPSTHVEGTSWQVLARSHGAESGDVLVIGEMPYRLLDRCGPHHWAVLRLAEITYATYESEVAADWLAEVEVWSARPVPREEPR